MIDFDDYFADKLREEQDFPHREQNWRLLQKRLGGSGIAGGSLHLQNLRFWKVAATIALLISSGLAWALFSGQQENKALRRQIAVLESSKPATTPVAATPPAHTDFSPAPPGVTTKPAESNTVEQNPVSRLSQTTHQRANALRQKMNARPDAGSPVDQPFTPLRQSGIPETIRHTELAVTGIPVSIENQAITGAPSALRDSMHALVESPRADSIGQAALSGKDTLTTTTAQAAVIRPARALSRLRVGMQGLVGLPLPHEKGISLLTGHGFRAEFALYKNVWLTASVDWLRFEVSTDRFVPRVHHHHHHPDTLQGSPQSKLVKVESTQRQQQFGLGLRYAIPLRFWLKPSVRAAYTWVHGSPETIRFEFKKPMKNDPPEYFVQKSKGGQLGNILRVGAGLEHVTHDWVFGLWADYSKNLAKADTGFDALTIQAGLLYRFN